MKKIGFHILFWVFIAFYVFDYFIDSYTFKSSIGYTLYEVAIFSLEFYINLFVLLPFLYAKNRKIIYFGLLIVMLSLLCSSFFVLNLNKEVLGISTERAIISFILNHSLFILMSYFVWYFYSYGTFARNSRHPC